MYQHWSIITLIRSKRPSLRVCLSSLDVLSKEGKNENKKTLKEDRATLHGISKMYEGTNHF